jgi:hypothetical protein
LTIVRIAVTVAGQSKNVSLKWSQGIRALEIVILILMITWEITLPMLIEENAVVYITT